MEHSVRWMRPPRSQEHLVTLSLLLVGQRWEDLQPEFMFRIRESFSHGQCKVDMVQWRITLLGSVRVMWVCCYVSLFVCTYALPVGQAFRTEWRYTCSLMNLHCTTTTSLYINVNPNPNPDFNQKISYIILSYHIFIISEVLTGGDHEMHYLLWIEYIS